MFVILRYGWLFLMMLSVVSMSGASVVKPGIETLRDRGFADVAGKRIGLITNPTGVDSQLRPTIDILAGAPGVTLVSLFAPEHGIRGDVVAGAKVAATRDTKTGLPVYSLYGTTKRPTRQMLDGLDALVYDIQDNGCRSYTFISTMLEAMRAAADAGIEFIVLDRPNPLGGNRVEGGGVDGSMISFVGALDIPYLYGLTAGELAGYIVDEVLPAENRKLKLKVIPLEGWHRNMLYDATGLPWVLPSPHLPQASTALYYPASGLLGELDFVSIGVGYTLPFETFAAPWIDAPRLTAMLNENASQDGAVAWREIHYKPYYGKFKGEQVHGVQMFVIDEERASLTRPQFDVMEALYNMYPDRQPLKRTENNRRLLNMFDKVTGSADIRSRLVENRYKADAINDLWRPSPHFVDVKPQYHLYE